MRPCEVSEETTDGMSAGFRDFPGGPPFLQSPSTPVRQKGVYLPNGDCGRRFFLLLRPSRVPGDVESSRLLYGWKCDRIPSKMCTNLFKSLKFTILLKSARKSISKFRVCKSALRERPRKNEQFDLGHSGAVSSVTRSLKMEPLHAVHHFCFCPSGMSEAKVTPPPFSRILDCGSWGQFGDQSVQVSQMVGGFTLRKRQSLEGPPPPHSHPNLKPQRAPPFVYVFCQGIYYLPEG